MSEVVTRKEKFLPQITNLSIAVVKNAAVGVVGGGLRHNSIYSSVDARRVHPISMDTIVMTYQVAVSNEGSAT